MSVHGRAPHDVFVAPDGDDAAPGTREEPVASLRRARDLLRARPDAERAEHGPVTVWVRGGDYLLPAGLRLTAEDSGTADAPVTWCACPGERVRLIGGVRVDGFEPWRDEILQADLAGPLAAAGMDEIPPHLPKRYQVDPDAAPESCELYLDGERQTAARWPNTRREPGKAGRWAYVAGVRDDLDWLLEPEGSVFTAGSDRIRAWQHNPEDIQVHVFTNPNWADDVLNLDHVDAGTPASCGCIRPVPAPDTPTSRPAAASTSSTCWRSSTSRASTTSTGRRGGSTSGRRTDRPAASPSSRPRRASSSPTAPAT